MGLNALQPIMLLLLITSFICTYSITAHSEALTLVFQTNNKTLIIKNNELHVIFGNGSTAVIPIPNASIINGLLKEGSIYLVGSFRAHPALIIINSTTLSMASLYYMAVGKGALFSLTKFGGRLMCTGYVEEGTTYKGLELVLNVKSGKTYGLIYTGILSNLTIPIYFRDVFITDAGILISGGAYWKGRYFPLIVIQDLRSLSVLDLHMYINARAYPLLMVNTNYIVKGILSFSDGKLQLLILRNNTLYIGELVAGGLELKEVLGNVMNAFLLSRGSKSWLVLVRLENNTDKLLVGESLCKLNVKGKDFFVENGSLLYLNSSGGVVKPLLEECVPIRAYREVIKLISTRLGFTLTNNSVEYLRINLSGKFFKGLASEISKGFTNNALGKAITVTQGVNEFPKSSSNIRIKYLGLMIAGAVLIMASYFIKDRIS